MINKNKISTTVSKARNTLIRAMCSAEFSSQVNLQGMSPEDMICLTVFERKGLHHPIAPAPSDPDKSIYAFVCDEQSNPLYRKLFEDTDRFIGNMPNCTFSTYMPSGAPDLTALRKNRSSFFCSAASLPAEIILPSALIMCS